MARASQKGICMNTGKTHFKKGHKPWNKGLTAETSPLVASVAEIRRGRKNPKCKRKPANFRELCRKAHPPMRRRFLSKDGYVLIYKPEYEGSGEKYYNHGRILEHKYIMELKIGRLLKKEERIHHWNGIKDDNHIENLRLCQGAREHTKIHQAEQRFTESMVKEGRAYFDEDKFEFRLR